MREIRALLGVALFLVACKPPGNSPPKPKPMTSKPSDAPTHVVGSAGAAPGSRLQPPPGNASEVTGTVLVDAGYAVGSGAATIIANNGGGLLFKGSPVVANNGGGLGANPGGSLISDNGLGLISDNGLGLISDNGLGLISDNGLGIVANNGGGYGLLQAGAPAPGTALPAGGLLVGVVSLADGKPLPLGVDAAGHPAYAAFTEPDGSYHLYLPASTSGNVRVVARPAVGSDPRLQYGLVAAPARLAGARVDEAGSQLAAFLRIRMARGLEEVYGRPLDAGASHELAGDAVLLQAVAQVAGELKTALVAAGFDALPPAGRRDALQFISDALVALIDLDTVTTSTTVRGWKADPREKATDALAALLHTMEERAAAVLARDPAFFETRPYMLELNRAQAAAGRPQFHVRRPSDVAALALGQYLSSTNERQFAKVDHLLVDLDLGPAERLHFRAAGGGIYTALAGTLIANEAARATLLAAVPPAIAAARAKPPASPAPPEPSPPAPAPVETGASVSTIAGTGARGFAEGTSAQFDGPAGLAIDERDPAHPALYIADGFNHRIRKLDLNTGAVSTVAGGTQGFADGPGATARFGVPFGLALDGRGHLVVGDLDQHRIRQLDLDAPGIPVTTLAGDGTAGLVDGPGATARFHSPWGLAFDAQGRLYVADTDNRRVRRLDPADPTHAVSSFAGLGDATSPLGPLATMGLAVPTALAWGGDRLVLVDGPRLLQTGPELVLRLLAGDVEGQAEGYWAGASFKQPSGLVLAPDGTAFVADHWARRVRVVSPAGEVGTLAGDGSDGGADGLAATFHDPYGIAIDRAGNLYVSEREGQRIRKITRRSAGG